MSDIFLGQNISEKGVFFRMENADICKCGDRGQNLPFPIPSTLTIFQAATVHYTVPTPTVKGPNIYSGPFRLGWSGIKVPCRFYRT